jgi:hypothetical protein
MKMSNIRPNFSSMQEDQQRHFFLLYADSREKDFYHSELIPIKQKKVSTKEPMIKVSKEQLMLLKALGIV